MTNGNDPINAITDLNAGPPTPGLSKREYFASLAMQGLCANAEIGTDPERTIAWLAVRQADALIEALNKEY